MNTKKNDFLAFISHKLLTPATVIKWNAELLNKDAKSENYDKVMERISDIVKSNNKQIDFVASFLKELEMANDLESLEISLMNIFNKEGN